MHLLVAVTIWSHRFVLLVSLGFTFLLPDIATAQTATAPPSPLHNITRLTSDSDNGEAYFSWDDTRLIWQSNRGGYACDKIWTMRLDGGDKRMVSPDHGAHTCSFFFPGDTAIVYASTSQLPGACPSKPDAWLTGKYRYTWPLYPYDIFFRSGRRRQPETLDHQSEVRCRADHLPRRLANCLWLTASR